MYTDVILKGLLYFPIVALLITFPYMLYEYHKFGSIHPYRTFIIYSFVLYLLIAYFLVILPLPTFESVATLTTPRMQLIPFSFINDIIKENTIVLGNINTYLPGLAKSCFYVPLYNVFLTLPFGIYLHYYFKLDLKKVTIFSFLLSLFFELTQLTGLYFIYPRGYRLFDVDDLLLNTLGGVIGYYIAFIAIKILPSKDEINDKAYEIGKKVSFIKRITVYIFDILIYFTIDTIIYTLTNKNAVFILWIIYYILIPIIFKRTIGQKFLNIKLQSMNDKKISILRIVEREILLITTYYGFPIIIIYIFFLLYYYLHINLLFGFIVMFIILIYYIIVLIKLIRNKDLLYEKISKIKLKSTILQNCNVL